MYPVSSAFLEAVKANTRKYYWTGRITTTAGTVYEFDQNDMVKGSGYITSQCCGSTEIYMVADSISGYDLQSEPEGGEECG